MTKWICPSSVSTPFSRQTSVEQSRILVVHSSFGPNVLLFTPGLECLRAAYDSLMQADLYRAATSFFRIGLNFPSNTNFSCNFSRDLLAVFVFALHPDSPMMSGACSKSGSIAMTFPVSSVPTLNTRFNTRIRFASESSDPSVPTCIWISEVSRCHVRESCGTKLHFVHLFGILPTLHRSNDGIAENN